MAGVLLVFPLSTTKEGEMNEAYIVAAVRTAGGRRDGRLKDWHPADLAGRVIDALLDRSGVAPEMVEDVIICLLYTSPSPRDATLSRMPSSA